MKILVTGFECFGKLLANPSAHVLEGLSADMLPGCTGLVTELLPVTYADSGARIRSLLELHQPELCICLGVAQNRRELCLERIALNLDDCSMADNAGELRQARVIDEAEPLALRSQLDLEALKLAAAAEHLADAPTPGLKISNHAGNFVCNHVYFHALQHIACRRLATQCLFIHVPMTSECRGPDEEYAWELPSDNELLLALGRIISAASRLLESGN